MSIMPTSSYALFARIKAQAQLCHTNTSPNGIDLSEILAVWSKKLDIEINFPIQSDFLISEYLEFFIVLRYFTI